MNGEGVVVLVTDRRLVLFTGAKLSFTQIPFPHVRSVETTKRRWRPCLSITTPEGTCVIEGLGEATVDICEFVREQAWRSHADTLPEAEVDLR